MTQCTCPICDHEATYVRVYQHLQTGHRKSALCRTLLDERGEGSESPPEGVQRDRGPTDTEEGPKHRDPAIPN